MKNLTAHPLAESFPMMGDEELKHFGQQLKAEGQHHPIIVCGNQIIDGRNRYRACELVGLEPEIEEREFENDDAIRAYIRSENLNRRDLEPGQKAVCVLKLHFGTSPTKTLPRKERERIAKESLVSERTLGDAFKLLKSGNKGVIKEVYLGVTTLPKALKSLKKTRGNVATSRRGKRPDPTVARVNKEAKTNFETFEEIIAALNGNPQLRKASPKKGPPTPATITPPSSFNEEYGDATVDELAVIAGKLSDGKRLQEILPQTDYLRFLYLIHKNVNGNEESS